jgi:hypothetical protein
MSPTPARSSATRSASKLLIGHDAAEGSSVVEFPASRTRSLLSVPPSLKFIH